MSDQVFIAAANSLKADRWTLLSAKFLGRRIEVVDEVGVTKLREWGGKVYLIDFKPHKGVANGA